MVDRRLSKLETFSLAPKLLIIIKKKSYSGKTHVTKENLEKETEKIT